MSIAPPKGAIVMDVNVAEWSQREFFALAEMCVDKNGTCCNKTGWACRDMLCPVVKAARNIKEVRANFAQQAK